MGRIVIGSINFVDLYPVIMNGHIKQFVFCVYLIDIKVFFLKTQEDPRLVK